MTLQRNVLELFAVHDKYSKKEVITRVPGKKDERKFVSRENSDIYFDVCDRKKEFRAIPDNLEKYLNSVGTLLDGSFYASHEHHNELTYHIGGSTLKIGIQPLRAGCDVNDDEGTDWAVFGYKLDAELTGSDSQKIQENLSGKLKHLGFNIVDKERFSNSRDYYVGF